MPDRGGISTPPVPDQVESDTPVPGVGRVDILGVQVSTVDMAAALRQLEGWIEDGAAEYVCVTGVHGVMVCQDDDCLLEIHNRSGLTLPDGMPMVWLGRQAGADWMERVCGPDLTLELCRLAAARGWRSFFYGGAPGVPEDLAAELGRRFPGLVTAGTFSPPFRELTATEKEDVADMINRARPHLVWVGLSTPKQERWMAEFRPRLDAPVILGVGAVFDLYSGRTRRAPRWMQRTGLEWLFRLLHEPRRLAGRYLTNNPRFLLAVARRRPRLIIPPIRPRGAFVVVVGPDGSGKTTVARALLETHRGRYFHFRPPFRASSMPAVPPLHQPPNTKDPGPSPVVLGWLRLMRNVVSSWIGYLAAVRPSVRRGDLVVGDRFMYGYLVQPRPLKFAGPPWLARIGIALLPRPDLVVSLEAPAQTVHDRKKELSLEVIEQEMSAWKALPVGNLVSVDGSPDPAQIAEKIGKHLA